MPGKVNPVIPEVVNQVAFEVIGNDLTITLAAEGGQLQLNAFEPIIARALFASLEHLTAGTRVLTTHCVRGITANTDQLARTVAESIGLVTALSPLLGYERATAIAAVDQGVTASQFVAPTLAARQHWWRVRGVNSAGTLGAWSAVRSFTPRAVAGPAALSALSVSPASVTGGASSQGTITLTGAAPAGGLAVSLSSSSSAVTVPATVAVAQGATSATFAIATTAVTASTAATVTAAAGGVTRTATLTVTAPGQAATLTVTASGRGGERITSNPAGIDVASGSSGSASFTTGTSITLTVSNGRDAIWSGACSSGGSKAKTCRFTIGSAAAVSASIQ